MNPINAIPVTRNIIIINVLLYAVTKLLYPDLKYQLVAYMPTSPLFHSWQIFTHMFMHGTLMHLLFNMLTLWSFGSILEQALGGRHFAILYFLSGLGSFILFNFWNYYQVYDLTQALLQQGVDVREIYLNVGKSFVDKSLIESKEAHSLMDYLSMPMLGASGAIFGAVAGFGTLFPDSKISLMFIPYPIKAKYLLPIVILISAYLGIRQFEWDNVAHFAHIGGALVGWLMIRNWKANRNIR